MQRKEINKQQIAEQEFYKRVKLLGEGSFGKAYLVECTLDKTLCVIKQMDMNNMSEEEKRETIKEARILEALKHPNIVRFREVYKTKKGKLCIVMDYADGGDLAKKIKDSRGVYFRENLILDWFTQISLAIKHCHDRKIIHRDLKAQNIFLTKDKCIQLGDFGIAKVLHNTQQKCKTMVGTPYYLSPEIINNQPYSFKTDIWSIGIVLYEMCALKPPFDAQSLDGLALKIVRGQYPPLPSIYSRDLKNLVSTLLQVDPNKRPSINEMLNLPIITKRISNFLSESIKIKEFSHTILHQKKFVNENDHNVQYPQARPQVQQREIFNNKISQKPNIQIQNKFQQFKQVQQNFLTPQSHINPSLQCFKKQQQHQNNQPLEKNNFQYNNIDRNQQQINNNKQLPLNQKPLNQMLEEKKNKLKQIQQNQYIKQQQIDQNRQQSPLNQEQLQYNNYQQKREDRNQFKPEQDQNIQNFIKKDEKYSIDWAQDNKIYNLKNDFAVPKIERSKSEIQILQQPLLKQQQIKKTEGCVSQQQLSKPILNYNKEKPNLCQIQKIEIIPEEISCIIDDQLLKNNQQENLNDKPCQNEVSNMPKNKEFLQQLLVVLKDKDNGLNYDNIPNDQFMQEQNDNQSCNSNKEIIENEKQIQQNYTDRQYEQLEQKEEIDEQNNIEREDYDDLDEDCSNLNVENYNQTLQKILQQQLGINYQQLDKLINNIKQQILQVGIENFIVNQNSCISKLNSQLKQEQILQSIPLIILYLDKENNNQ